ncbi:MAG TPA: TetR/AcrR family transcriptional regulator [Candidatus Binatia bacterium]|nr:TetR/AcrR family transcriptional regulator [Candidatus Binatia bacterium]
MKEGVLPEDLSYADVGARAGVATRTVYRHFPETSDLLSAVAMATMARITDGVPAVDLPGAAAQLARTHEALCADPSLFHVFAVTPLRSGLDYSNYVRAIFADVLARLPEERRDAVAATFEILSNPLAWRVMHEFWHLPREQITRTALAAAQAVADRFVREPQLLDPSAPLPPLFRAPQPANPKERPTKGNKR